MKTKAAAFATDGINRQNMLLPLKTLLESMETMLATAVEWNFPYGMPLNLAHDLCRPIGWSEPRGIYIARDMARQLGMVNLPETDDEREQIATLCHDFSAWFQFRNVEPYSDRIQAKVADYATAARRLWYCEAAGAYEPGLASKMFPEFFTSGPHVDKDGLVDFDHLTSRSCQVQPGVFHEPERDVLLFAHRYIRRSLSLRNILNTYFLQSFSHAAGLGDVTARLRLDPDLIGHPESVHSRIELEYWHGPKFDDDIAAIPAGVAEHKNSDDDRFYSRIDKTQIWWKEPETRPDAGTLRQIRTFEIEELTEEESPGLAAGVYGCRYAHAEYDLTKGVLSHFDGAIRAYPGDAYLDRIQRRIDRSGKHSDYTKLFRLDGMLPVALWKRILTDWYRGNRLVPEYLGAPEEDLAEAFAPSEPSLVSSLPALSAFVCLEKAPKPPADILQIMADQSVTLDANPIVVAEIGQGAVGVIMRRWLDPHITSIAAKDTGANLARIVLPGNKPSRAEWMNVARPLAAAIAADAEAGVLERVALAISWWADGIIATLSIEGEADGVAGLLADAVLLVCPDIPASCWIEEFRDALVSRAPQLEFPVEWPENAARRGRLSLLRTGDLEFQIQLGTNLIGVFPNGEDTDYLS